MGRLVGRAGRRAGRRPAHRHDGRRASPGTAPGWRVEPAGVVAGAVGAWRPRRPSPPPRCCRPLAPEAGRRPGRHRPRVGGAGGPGRAPRRRSTAPMDGSGFLVPRSARAWPITACSWVIVQVAAPGGRPRPWRCCGPRWAATATTGRVALDDDALVGGGPRRPGDDDGPPGRADRGADHPLAPLVPPAPPRPPGRGRRRRGGRGPPLPAAGRDRGVGPGRRASPPASAAAGRAARRGAWVYNRRMTDASPAAPRGGGCRSSPLVAALVAATWAWSAGPWRPTTATTTRRRRDGRSPGHDGPAHHGRAADHAGGRTRRPAGPRGLARPTPTPPTPEVVHGTIALPDHRRDPAPARGRHAHGHRPGPQPLARHGAAGPARQRRGRRPPGDPHPAVPRPRPAGRRATRSCSP